MYKNPVWISLIGLVFVAMLWYGFHAIYHLYNYYSLKEATQPVDIKWFVDEISSEDFRVGATYSYRIDDQSYQGETIFRIWT